MTLPTGEGVNQAFYTNLLKRLQVMGVRYGLDTAEMEALTAWVSMETASHTQSIDQAAWNLKVGLKKLLRTSVNPLVTEVAWISTLYARQRVRYAVIIRRKNVPDKLIVYLARDRKAVEEA